MRKALIAAAVLGTLASALPAAAQSYGNPYGGQYGQRGDGYGYDRGQGYGQQPAQRIWQLRQAIDRLVQQGRLDRREAVYFQRSVERLSQLDRRYRFDGYTSAERRDIDLRASELTRALRQASGRGGYGYGNRDGYDNDGRYDRRGDDRRDYDRGYQRDDDDDDDDGPRHR